MAVPAAVFAAAIVVGVVMLVGSKAKVTGEKPEDRAASIAKIAVARPPGARKALSRAVLDGSPDVRRAALAGLTHMLEPDDRPVVEKATQDTDPQVRAIAADTLGLYRDRMAADRLIGLVETDKNDRVRIAALRGLARCEDPRAVVVLLERADKDPKNSIKMQAMKSLLWRFKGKISEVRDPSNPPVWKDLIQRFKWDGRVRRAYAAAGVPIIDRPQDILGRDWHPERRGPGAELPSAPKPEP